MTAAGGAEGRRGPVLLATRNRGKLRELAPLFSSWGVAVQLLDDVGLAEDPAEDHLECHHTFAENALAKARFFQARRGGLVLAEDSGLCVDALDGAPGVHSKRWAAHARMPGYSLDASNTVLLLERLAGVTQRGAHYACSAALVWEGGELVAEGRAPGRILAAPRGEGGFGYDPVFWSDDLQACFAAVPSAEKARVSHRTRAVASVWDAYRAAVGPL